jgi:hypothetical protein
MNVTKFIVPACCGTTTIIFKTSQPLNKSHIVALQKLGFVESAQFTASGLLHVNNPDFIITGPLGQDRLTVKCRNADCDQKLKELEVLLQQLG